MAAPTPLDIFDLRRTHFVLWAPHTAQSPSLVIARYNSDRPEGVEDPATHALHKEQEDVWLIKAESLGLQDGVYHYWFLINDTSAKHFGAMLVTDPLAYSVDYRNTKYPGGDMRNAQWRQPASLVMLRAGELLPCDPSGIEFTAGQIPSLESLPLNTQLVIYELPTSWSRAGQEPGDTQERDVGSFLDVRALLDEDVGGGNFQSVAEVRVGAHLLELGINALELLPPADAKARREWGYATANYFASDYDLGLPVQYQVSRALEDLGALVSTCHKNGIRFITDDVMAFGHDPYIHIAYQQFHIIPNAEPDNPDSYQSSRNNEKRDGWGGESWRYINPITTWGPLTGTTRSLSPAWEFHRLQLKRWMSDFHVDGLRLDSVNNIGNWDFIRRFTSDAHEHFRSRNSHPSTSERPDDRFLVIAEELAVPLDMIRSGTVDALWNETFQGLLRAAILGQSADDHTNFEWTVRKMIDCRHLGFTSSTQAVNYITSHDVAGYRKERLYDFLQRNGVFEKQQRTKLAFVCLLTAVGIPMIFAGEEFCDQMDRHDLEKNMGQEKQIDPVNFGRRDEPWRKDVFEHNRKLIALRKRSEALGVVDTEFIHVDFSNGRRILGWVRGNTSTHDVVVVVANFSEKDTTSGRYVFNNWPRTPEGKRWREVTSDRVVTADLVDREPLGPWQAKVYEMLTS
ncbi:putative alpha amylase, catalytic domain subfamily [Paraphoma chrysanthemicola]|uniref:Alpha amylase, catalytic domain subfamily n=1 Tax=Paraphoma chrysanthemicola TaxID=798071 RepID=A0A8K0W3H0_9PLEO|nr:putative alpha amylase, catalytic domain subfamily [Paraphoma chrysanthemicola]